MHSGGLARWTPQRAEPEEEGREKGCGAEAGARAAEPAESSSERTCREGLAAGSTPMCRTSAAGGRNLERRGLLGRPSLAPVIWPQCIFPVPGPDASGASDCAAAASCPLACSRAHDADFAPPGVLVGADARAPAATSSMSSRNGAGAVRVRSDLGLAAEEDIQGQPACRRRRPKDRGRVRRACARGLWASGGVAGVNAERASVGWNSCRAGWRRRSRSVEWEIRRMDRMKTLLESYYGVGGDSGGDGNEASKRDLDSAKFDEDAFVRERLVKSSFAELLRKDDALVQEVRTLDADMQLLVYDNYSKFISATDTIRSMKDKVDEIEGDIGQMVAKVEHISQVADKINERT
ncbi:Vacuolar protein sorting-associated protein 51 homolog (Protein fat-free homolog), partial [Durusdinium trenchii]